MPTTYEIPTGGVTTTPFDANSKASSVFAGALDPILGQEWFSAGNKTRIMLVRLDNASGVVAPGKKRFKFSSGGSPTFDVTPTTAATDRTVGIAVTGTPDLVDNDYFFLIVEGEADVISDGAIAVGDYVKPSGSTAGRTVTNTTTFAEGVTDALAIEAAAGAAETIKVRFLR